MENMHSRGSQGHKVLLLGSEDCSNTGDVSRGCIPQELGGGLAVKPLRSRVRANMSMVTGTQLELRRMTSASKPFCKGFGLFFL